MGGCNVTAPGDPTSLFVQVSHIDQNRNQAVALTSERRQRDPDAARRLASIEGLALLFAMKSSEDALD